MTVSQKQPKVLFPCSSLLQSVMTDKVGNHKALRIIWQEAELGFRSFWQPEFLSSDFFNVKCKHRFWQPGWPSHVCVPYTTLQKQFPFVSPSLRTWFLRTWLTSKLWVWTGAWQCSFQEILHSPKKCDRASRAEFGPVLPAQISL